jgi:hypothetical protein
MPAGSQRRVFLCHASEDKAEVRKLYKRLRLSGFTPWLDEEDLVPGQEWQAAIALALSDSAAVLVCLSSRAISKGGYVQKEIKYALDRAEEMPEGRVYIIPVMLEMCKIPERLSKYHCANITTSSGFDRLVLALEKAEAERFYVAPPVRLLVHRAAFVFTGQQCYFVNATNTTDSDVELTHIWFETEPPTHVVQSDRPLPKRLRPQETWEIWVSVYDLPTDARDDPYLLARARLSTGTVVESRRNDTVPGVGFVPGGEVNFSGEGRTADILPPIAMVFVDVMRMLYTMAAPAARAANVARFAEFIRIAEQHWGVLRTHIALQATTLRPSLRISVAGIDRRLSGLLGKCKSGPDLTGRELRLAFELAQNLALAIEELGSQVPEYLELKDSAQRLAKECHPTTLDELFRIRLDLQNEILRPRTDLQTIADDMDLKLALPYCAIDQELLGQPFRDLADIS